MSEKIDEKIRNGYWGFSKEKSLLINIDKKDIKYNSDSDNKKENIDIEDIPL